MNVDEALALAREVAPGQTWFTHLSHDVLHAEAEAALPPSVRIAFDGSGDSGQIDEMNAFTSDKLIKRMGKDPTSLRSCLNLIFVSRHLERTGDLATNIAEGAVYTAAAYDIRYLTARSAVG